MLRLCCAAVFALFAFPAWGEPVTPMQLYRAETIVTGVFEPERTRGIREALRAVVVKVTGNQQLRRDPRVDRLAARARRLVASFEYEDRMKGIPIHDEQGTRDRPHFLRVRFKAAAVDDWLAKNGLRKWPRPRALVYVHLTVKTARGTFLVRRTGANGYAQRAVIQETSVRRGIPVRLPAGKSGNNGRKAPIQPRLVGTLTITDAGFWNIDWVFSNDGKAARFGLKSVTFDRAIRFGFDKVSRALRP